jgi:hypothetical protein
MLIPQGPGASPNSAANPLPRRAISAAGECGAVVFKKLISRSFSRHQAPFRELNALFSLTAGNSPIARPFSLHHLRPRRMLCRKRGAVKKGSLQ